MATTEKKYVIVGGGLAGGTAIETLIAGGASAAEILLIAQESEHPYQRPPLSKGYLAGREDRPSVFVPAETFFDEHPIETRLSTKVTKLLPAERLLETDQGDEIEFDQLLLATGARPRKLSTPGGDLGNIFALRTLADSDAIKVAAKEAQQAVIVGAGFIGLEVAATLHGLGLEVTVLHRGTQLLDRFADAQIAQFFHDYFTQQGVVIRYEETVDHFVGENGRVTTVMTDKGTALAADLVVVGVGVELNLEYLQGTVIRLDNGVMVNEELETAVPGIFAAGDIASFPDLVFAGKRRRIEHWDHAQASGRLAAENMLGANKPYRHLSYFFSDMFDLSFELWGDTDGYQTVKFESTADPISAAAWYVNGDGIVTAYFAINRPDDEKNQAQDLITKHQPFEQG